MDGVFIERNIFIRFEGEMYETRITIEKPLMNAGGVFESKVIFSNVEKYNTTAKCIDEFSTIECALDYVEGICKNSDDPEFFITRDESMRGFDREGDGYP
jgi:hypothetical protein